MNKRMTLMTLAVLTGVGGGLAAQRSGPPRTFERGPAMGWCGGASTAQLCPQLLLRQRARLELTEAQVSQLEEMA